MMDILFLLLTVVLFALGGLYVAGCASLGRRQSRG
jgi:hypothetical protein